MRDIEYRLLGPVEVVHADRVLRIDAPRQLAVLACLLLEANRVVSVDRLITQLWGEQPPERARNTVQSLVLRLRRGLPTGAHHVLRTKPPGYLLRVDDGQLDLDQFDRLAANGRRQLADNNPRIAAQTLRAALELWRGEPLAGAAGTRLQEVDGARLREKLLQVTEDRMEADLVLGRTAELVAELVMSVADCPLRERLSAIYMVALYREGRQAEAFDVFHGLRRRLVDELGVEPGDLVQHLYRRMLDRVPGADLTIPRRYSLSSVG